MKPDPFCKRDYDRVLGVAQGLQISARMRDDVGELDEALARAKGADRQLLLHVRTLARLTAKRREG